MEPTTQTRRRGGSRARGSARAAAPETSRDADYDLLTAALIGVAIGVGTTLLLRSGPSGRSPAVTLVHGAGRAGRKLMPQRPSRGSRMRRRLAHYADTARDRMDALAAEELASLRRAIRRRRKQLGL